MTTRQYMIWTWVFWPIVWALVIGAIAWMLRDTVRPAPDVSLSETQVDVMATNLLTLIEKGDALAASVLAYELGFRALMTRRPDSTQPDEVLRLEATMYVARREYDAVRIRP